MTGLLLAHGLLLLFALVAMESAGAPLPGETALVTAGVLAQRGHYSLVAVIAVAALAAIVGDNIGYWIGRRGGRALLRRTPVIRTYFDRALPPSERFFQRHGAKTVFLGRFIAVLRVTAAWMAGISRMPWWRFLLWNAAGGIVWAILVATLAYKFGDAAAAAVGRYGLFGLILVAAAAAIVFVGFKVWRNRVFEGA